MTFQLDTGANCNVMSAETFNSLDIRGKLKKIHLQACFIFWPQDGAIGKKVLTGLYKGQKYKVVFEIVQQQVPAILGKASCIKLGLVKQTYDIGKENNILQDFDDLLSGLGCLPGQHHIQIYPTVTLVVHVPRTFPVALRDKVVDQLHKIE